jgi:glycerol-3-phosphate acyltransferase PlsY
LEGIFYRVALGVVAVAGHNWTVFLQFKGGKGIATSLGVLIGLTIKVAAIRPVLFFSILSWLAVFLTTGFVSLSSIVAAILLPVLMVISNQPLELVSLGIIFCVLVIIRHRPNIKKLLSGEESRVNIFSKKEHH